MAKLRNTPSKKSDIFLGHLMAEKRRMCDMSKLEVAKKIKVIESQISKFEMGGFISLPNIEKLAEAYGEPVIKKIIRKISFIRKTEKENNVNLDDELIEQYSKIFEDI